MLKNTKAKKIKKDELSDAIRIRAHHLLCMQGFQGYGYSPEFVKNMNQIIDFLNFNPHTKIEIVSSVDNICSECPHKKNELCSESFGAETRIKTMDLKVINYLNLLERDIYTYNYFLKLIEEKIDFSKLKKICGDCSWINSCNLYLKLNNNNNNNK